MMLSQNNFLTIHYSPFHIYKHVLNLSSASRLSTMWKNFPLLYLDAAVDASGCDMGYWTCMTSLCLKDIYTSLSGENPIVNK